MCKEFRANAETKTKRRYGGKLDKRKMDLPKEAKIDLAEKKNAKYLIL